MHYNTGIYNSIKTLVGCSGSAVGVHYNTGIIIIVNYNASSVQRIGGWRAL